MATATIESTVRALVDGFKESQRLERQADKAQTAEQGKQVRDKVALNEAKVQEAGIQLAVLVLTDLHRIADAQEMLVKSKR